MSNTRRKYPEELDWSESSATGYSLLILRSMACPGEEVRFEVGGHHTRKEREMICFDFLLAGAVGPLEDYYGEMHHSSDGKSWKLALAGEKLWSRLPAAPLGAVFQVH